MLISSLENDNSSRLLVLLSSLVFFYTHNVFPDYFFLRSSSNGLLQKLFSRFYISFPFGALLCLTLAKYKNLI